MSITPARARIEVAPDEFRRIGHELIDCIADHLLGIRELRVSPGEKPEQVRDALGSGGGLPEEPADPAELLRRAAALLFHHSLFNGHPRFFGYVTSSAAPLGMLGDLLAAAVNPNVGGWALAPMATEIEAQTIRWIAQFIAYPDDCGGLLVSGGNMANFVGFLAARAASGGPGVRSGGMQQANSPLRCYCSAETHTWVQKAADLFGLGTDSVRWIPVDAGQRLRLDLLRERIDEDQRRGERPFLVVGNAGSVSTGAVDPLPELASFCRDRGLWFHVDGAYGGLAARVPGVPDDLLGLSEADSVAVDPHKWLYAPLEAGCALVRRRDRLRDAFSYHPPYYTFDPEVTNYFDLGPQNSRGFRALKVWLSLAHLGRSGCLESIGTDISLAQHLHRRLDAHPDFEALTCGLSIVTFRYVPPGLRSQLGSDAAEGLLNDINRDLLDRINASGRAFVSNAVIGGRFALRACIVNFRTSVGDVEALPTIVAELGRDVAMGAGQ